jgi:hypothetical protein
MDDVIAKESVGRAELVRSGGGNGSESEREREREGRNTPQLD